MPLSLRTFSCLSRHLNLGAVQNMLSWIENCSHFEFQNGALFIECLPYVHWQCICTLGVGWELLILELGPHLKFGNSMLFMHWQCICTLATCFCTCRFVWIEYLQWEVSEHLWKSCLKVLADRDYNCECRKGECQFTYRANHADTWEKHTILSSKECTIDHRGMPGTFPHSTSSHYT